MRNFTFLFLCNFAFSVFAFKSNAQCPTPAGMVATSLQFNGNCYMLVQAAIPSSNVSIYNGTGYVAQASASAQGIALVPFPCSANPITAVISLAAGGNFCNTVSISLPITLPVKIISFTSQITAQGVLLKWTTSYELNNSKYVIEKSDDGRTYQTIGEKAGSENSFTDKNYQFSDINFKTGDIAFYRLRQVDIDGKSSYSKVVYVNNSKAGGQVVKIFPNPFINEIQVAGISSANLNKGNIRFYNSTGGQVSFELSGSNAIKVSPDLPNGLYFLTIKGSAYKILKN